jgi:aminotransferase
MNYWENPYTEILHQHPHRECVRCVMDTSDPFITFDKSGVCNHCNQYEALQSRLPLENNRHKVIESLVERLQTAGRGHDYDCLIGLSGGVDSSYLAWFVVKKLKLRPLIIHVDTGWNSELAVMNIQNVINKLQLDMHTVVIDWNEIRDIQRSYFLSGIANLDVPQDHAFVSSLYSMARKFKIKNILNGGNLQTESILPAAWGYDADDSRNLLAIHKRYGRRVLKTYPIINTFKKNVFYPYICRIKNHSPLNYIDYNKIEAKNLLIDELGWRDYGGKHYESRFTRFFQSHYLPKKFGYDKRKAHLSSLIVSKQLTRGNAIKELLEPLYNTVIFEDDLNFFLKKLEISREEYDNVMSSRPSLFSDFDNNSKLNAILINMRAKFRSKFK